jgi:Yip1 domain
MTEVAAAAPDTPKIPDMGLAARIGNVFLAPGRAYEAVAARPRWFGVLTVCVVVMMVAQFVFLSSDVGQTAAMNQQLDYMKAFGVTITDQMVQQMESRMVYARYTGAAALLVFVPLIAAVVGGLLLAIFTVVSGGGVTYKQVFAVVAHSYVISMLALLFTLPISYAKEEMVNPARLSVFFPMLGDMGFPYYLLNSIDLFHIWGVANLSIGMAVLYKRRTGGAAAVLFGVYTIIVLIVATVRATL